MKSEKVKEMLDSCYMAKRILDMLPKLPEGVLPSYVRYLETIIELEEKNQKVKVSDVSEVLNLPRPGVTRTIHAMEEKGYLKKETAKHDGRVTYVTVTKEGKMIFEKYSKTLKNTVTVVTVFYICSRSFVLYTKRMFMV